MCVVVRFAVAVRRLRGEVDAAGEPRREAVRLERRSCHTCVGFPVWRNDHFVKFAP